MSFRFDYPEYAYNHSHLRWKLFRDSPINVNKLAKSLGISPRPLITLVRMGYLQVARRTHNYSILDKVPAGIVKLRRDPTGSLNWPLVQLAPFHKVTNKRFNGYPEFLKFLRTQGIPYRHDPVMGYCTSLDGGLKIAQILGEGRRSGKGRWGRWPANRGQLLMWMLGLDDWMRNGKGSGFHILLEEKINRVVRLPQPQRTEQAVKLLGRFGDVEKLIDAVRKVDDETVERLQRKLDVKKAKKALKAAAGIVETRGRRKQAVNEAGAVPPGPGRPAR